MSRSYKKFPVTRQDRVDKKLRNKKLRHLNIDYSIKNGQYRKVIFGGWNWHYRWTLDEAIEDYTSHPEDHKDFPTLESYIEYWKRCCYRK
jgi:hypothetical protein